MLKEKTPPFNFVEAGASPPKLMEYIANQCHGNTQTRRRRQRAKSTEGHKSWTKATCMH